MQSSIPHVHLALETIEKGKQAIVFLGTKRSCERAAEDIAKKIKTESNTYTELAHTARTVLSSPTKQCDRLALCLKKGIAFHHAGLAYKQRELVETQFREGQIKIICATPTLAMGIDLPAYRAIIRDVRRYGKRGLDWIPVLEYLQMAGRAGRPSYDNEGQAILIAPSEYDKEQLKERYIDGEPEEIFSKLAAEPALRMYVLSLIASGFTRTREEIVSFFSKTFYAHQFEDLYKLELVIDKMLHLLEEWEFIKGLGDDFVGADEMASGKIKATVVGKRVAELYLDPLTAHGFIKSLREASSKTLHALSFLHMVSHSLEMRPLLRVKSKEQDLVQGELMTYEKHLLEREPSLYDPEYEEFLDAFKTALMFYDWCEETSEDMLLEKYAIRPGELHAKREIADWLLYSCIELSHILHFTDLKRELLKMRIRVKYGVKEELLVLLKLKGIGRIRARKLHRNGVKTMGDVRKAGISKLKQLLGEKTALSVLEQIGEKVEAVSSGKRVGQVGLGKY